MTKREERVTNAFLKCIKNGEFTVEYAITIIEDEARYGWLSETAKEEFYSQLDNKKNDSWDSDLTIEVETVTENTSVKNSI